MPAKNKQKQQFDSLSKIAVIGDSSVGKTNILLRYVNQQYEMTHTATIGIDFKVKTLVLGDYRLKLQIWDTAGQERFRNLTSTIYQGAEALIIVYSITDHKSFENISRWAADIKDYANEGILLAIVGNKCDMEQDRQVATEEGVLMAKNMGAIFYQTSARQDINIKEVFNALGLKIKTRHASQNRQNNKETTGVPKETTPKTNLKLKTAPSTKNCEC